MPKIFGVIITYKPNMAILEKCIHGLKNQLAKIIIVDNTPGKCEILENLKTFPNIEVIYLADNYGIAYAQNVGIKRALEEKADYILLSDQDTVYPPDFVEKMLECFKDEKVAAAGPLYLDRITGKIQPFVKKGLFGFKKIYPKSGKHEVLQLIASGTIIKAKCLNDVGLFNNDLFIDWVDLEWCWRAIKRGYKIIGNADVMINHRLGDNVKNIGFKILTQRSPLRHYYITRNAVYLALRCNSLDILHRITLFLKSFRYILGYSIFMKPHTKNLKYTLKGFYHGIIGRLGKLNEES
jgi:rhamnosyltransferase